MKTLLQKLFPSLFKREIVHTPAKSSSNLKIFIPNLNKFGKHLPASKVEDWVRFFAVRFSQLFGGCSVSKNNQGYFFSEATQQLMVENTTEIRVTCFNGLDKETLEKLVSEFKEYGVDCLQEQVFYELDNQPYLIEI